MVEDLLETVVKELENRNFERAATMLEEIVKREPTNVKALGNLARAYYGSSRYRDSIRIAEKLEGLCPTCEEGYDVEALSIRQLSGSLDDVIDVYKKGYDANPKSSKLAHKLGKAYHESGDFDAAIYYYSAAIDLDSLNIQYLLDRAIAYMNSGKDEDAYIDLRKILNLDPENPIAREILSEATGTRLTEDDINRGLTRFTFTKVRGINLSMVVGLEDLKRELVEKIIYPLQYRELSLKYRVSAGGGTFLYGPPGCGKTYIVKALAGQTSLNLLDVRIPEVLDKWSGNAERNIHNLFELARRNAPTIIFIDEVDALGGKREESVYSGSRLSVNTLLMEMDSISSRNENVLIIGATNAPWLLDPAAIRSGRFSSFIYVPPPDRKLRADLFKRYLKGRPVSDNVDFDRLADLTSGYYSSSDIVAITYEAAKIPWREAIETGSERKIDQKDLEIAISRIKPTLIQWFEDAVRSEKLISSAFQDLSKDVAAYKKWKSSTRLKPLS
ncbi:MAG: AAA family ATPase [Thermoplasmatales archaeon]